MKGRVPMAVLLGVVAASAVLIALVAGGGAGAPPAAGGTRGAGGAGGGHATAGAPPGPGAGAGSLSTSTAGGAPVDASRFSRGACEAFPPTTGDSHHTVFIDAGHGGVDPGGQGVTESGKVIYEAGENLAIELETMNLLRAEGYRVVVSRTSNTYVLRPTPSDLTSGVLSVEGAKADIAARDACADLARATILIGIYFDAGTSPLDAGSLTAYDPVRSFAAKSRSLATLLQRDVLSQLNAHGWQIPDDGVQPDTTLGGIPLTTTAAIYRHLLLLGPADPGWFTTASSMPGALIEPLFISDPFEGSIADSALGHLAIAEGMAHAVVAYFRTTSG